MTILLGVYRFPNELHRLILINEVSRQGLDTTRGRSTGQHKSLLPERW